MTLKQLEAFLVAATLGSFALAARRVHVTQSSLSKRIAELEAFIGTALFDRSAKRVRLTEAGHRLLPVAAQMLELKESARLALERPHGLRGACRFGISELGALTWLPQFVAQARLTHPELVLQPHVDLSRRLEQQVLRGELDFAVVPGPPESPTIVPHIVEHVRFTWMAAPGRVPAGLVLTAEDLARHPVITMTEGSGLTQAFNVWAGAQGLRMPRIVASNSLMAIIGLTLADVGMSFLPAAFTRLWVERGLLIPLESNPPLPSLPYAFIHREDDRRMLLPVLLDLVTAVAQFSDPAGFSRTSPG